MSVLQNQGERLRELEADVDNTSKNGSQFDTLEDLMKPYKKHLLQSAFDLQSRLKQQVEPPKGKEPFLYDFCNLRARDGENTRDRDYAIHSTAYIFAEFMAWMQVIRAKIVFVTGSHDAEVLNSLLEAIRFQFTGESPIQGSPMGPPITKNDTTSDVHHHIMQLYIVDIRSIGNAMLVSETHAHSQSLLRPITVDTFQQRMSAGGTYGGDVEGATPSSAAIEADAQHAALQKILAPLYNSIRELAKLKRDEAPRRRLAIIQVLLCKLIDILDSAVPWDYPPKFDSNEEPRYIQRDFRITPMVKHLSNTQKDYLQATMLFASDPNLSFPGFREDLAEKTQEERDNMLWPGACPPIEPRRREEAWHKRHNMQIVRALRPSHSFVGRGGPLRGATRTLLIEEPQGHAWLREVLVRVSEVEGIGGVAVHPDASDVMVATVSADPVVCRAAINAIARACPRATVEEVPSMSVPGGVVEGAGLPGLVNGGA
ncbi:hypothetical protein FOA52_015897 [Chlamydomonas sp. UWO 241]|nr:hypothetical protein FOA52_015897 [Chlamydomonas sp. UWO 241]